jgi:homoserine dehydrogenase
LLQLAREKQVQFRYEGTMLAGTPLLNLAETGLAGLEIRKVEGIVNGTCNYILTRMEEGMAYQDALKKAQELGYAEANPEADVEGWDAVAKVMILSQALFQHRIPKEEVEREGITGISLADVEAAQKQNESWKLIASVENRNGQIIASVKPQRIPNSHPLAGVKGATNAVTLTTDYLQQVTIVGPGAGKHETGYAVLNDLIAIHQKMA